MKLEITDEWLLSFDENTSEPSGYITPRERADIGRRRETAQTAALQPSSAQESNKTNTQAIPASS